MSDIGMGQPSITSEKPEFAGIWSRLAAFAVDTAILAIPAFIVGFGYPNWAASLGQAGRLIGFLMMLLYFGYFDSTLGVGQTLGKQLLGVKVVGRTGATLSPVQAVLRFLIIGIPYFLNGISINVTSLWQQHLIAVLLSVIIFGVGGSILYLFIFNRRTHQSLHDFLTGSFVTRYENESSLIISRIATLHLAVVSCLLILALVTASSSIINSKRTSLSPSQLPLVALQRAVQTGLGVQRVGIFAGTTKFWSVKDGDSTESYLTVTVRADQLRGSSSSLIPKIAAIVIHQSPDLLGRPILVIQVQRGFDFGIARWTVSQHESHDKATWLSLLASGSAVTNGL